MICESGEPVFEELELEEATPTRISMDRSGTHLFLIAEFQMYGAGGAEPHMDDVMDHAEPRTITRNFIADRPHH